MNAAKEILSVIATIALFFIGFGVIVGVLTRLVCFGFAIVGGTCW